jgi:hypothetical protein
MHIDVGKSGRNDGYWTRTPTHLQPSGRTSILRSKAAKNLINSGHYVYTYHIPSLNNNVVCSRLSIRELRPVYCGCKSIILHLSCTNRSSSCEILFADCPRVLYFHPIMRRVRLYWKESLESLGSWLRDAMRYDAILLFSIFRLTLALSHVW